MYQDDSFYTLSSWGQAGLVLLSLTLSLICIWSVFQLSRRYGLLIGVISALLIFYGFVWLSPQVYYTYYGFLFEGLPAQIVIKSPPGLVRIGRLFVYQEAPTFAAHSKGVLAHALLVAVIVAHWRRAAK